MHCKYAVSALLYEFVGDAFVWLVLADGGSGREAAGMGIL